LVRQGGGSERPQFFDRSPEVARITTSGSLSVGHPQMRDWHAEIDS
jgi:hypothetical protein